MELTVGQDAPDFIIKNQDGKELSLKDLNGKFVILYFYPKDMTKGCTIEAKEFSSYIDEFIKLDAIVVGVSPDSVESHQKFISKENLKHTLLSDITKSIAIDYGVWSEKSMYGKKYMGIVRSSFIIKEGKILETFYNVKSTGHAKDVLDYLKKIANS